MEEETEHPLFLRWFSSLTDILSFPKRTICTKYFRSSNKTSNNWVETLTTLILHFEIFPFLFLSFPSLPSFSFHFFLSRKFHCHPRWSVKFFFPIKSSSQYTYMITYFNLFINLLLNKGPFQGNQKIDLKEDQISLLACLPMIVRLRSKDSKRWNGREIQIIYGNVCLGTPSIKGYLILSVVSI